MLVSIAVDPRCFRREELTAPEAMAGAARILEAVRENAILIAREIDPFVRALIDSVMEIDVRQGEELQLLVAEIAKSRNRFIRAPQALGRVAPSARIDELLSVAVDMRADALIVSVSDAGMAAAAGKGIEVCTVSQYRKSRIEERRRAWLRAQRLDKLSAAESGELIGRAVMYLEEIFIVDKMIARNAKDGYVTAKLRTFARGVVHVVEQWRRWSPHATRCEPSIVVLSAAGAAAAAAGYVDPEKAEEAIRQAVKEADKSRIVGNLIIDLRQDRAPGIFNDRFLAGPDRCWGVGHGFDDIANLASSNTKRRPTIIAPDCQAYRDTLGEIRSLPKARKIGVIRR